MHEGRASGGRESSSAEPPWLGDLAPLDREHLSELRELLRGEHLNLVVPVVGSGLSQPALPGWRQLLEELVDLLPSGLRPKFHDELDGGRLTEVATVLVAELEGGEASLQKFLASRFSEEALRHLERPLVYDHLASLGPTQALTTNYDPWTHQSLCDRLNRPVRKLVAGSEDAFANLDPTDPFVLYLHGDANDPMSCVLTQEQYAGRQFQTRGYVESLGGLCAQRRLLLVGHSARDPDLGWVLEQGRWVLGSNVRHFLIGFGLDHFERMRLLHYGIAPIEIGAEGQHERLADVLAWLAAPAQDERPSVSLRPQPPHEQAQVEGLHRSATECPFPGLRIYDESRAELYFGRGGEAEELIAELARRLDQRRLPWVQIDGASGLGKSSLAHAGVLPRVRAGRLQAQASTWRIGQLRPGNEPLRALALALRQALGLEAATEDLVQRMRGDEDALRNLLEESLPALGPQARFFLLFDQMEELFTLHLRTVGAQHEQERDQPRSSKELESIDGNLAAALRAEPCRLVLLTTIRRDFEGELRRLERLDALLPHAHRKDLRPVPALALEGGMREIASRFGLGWSPADLPARLAAEAAAMPAGLPLLAVALETLWNERDGTVLSARTYDRWSSLGRALGDRAEEVYARVASQIGEAQAERRLSGLFLDLVRPGVGTKDTRKLVPRSEALAAAGGDEVAEELLHLVSGLTGRFWPESGGRPPYLVAVGEAPGRDEPQVELAHERLLEDWDRLAKEWLLPHRERLAWRDQLEAVAALWAKHGANPKAVDVGLVLDQYAKSDSTDRNAVRYVAAGMRRRKRATMLRRGAAAVIVLAFVALSGWLYREQRRSNLDARIQAAVRWFEGPWPSSLLEELRQVHEPAQLDLLQARLLLQFELLGEAEQRLSHMSFSRAAADRARYGDARRLCDLHLRHGSEAEGWVRRLSDLDRLWTRVQSAGGPSPTYDLWPLQPPQPADPARWEFALVASGALPDWDAHPPWHSEESSVCTEGCTLAGQWKVGPETAMLFALVPAGKVWMGSPPLRDDSPPHEYALDSERPRHLVPLDAFYVALHECTKGQWARLSGARESTESSLPKTSHEWVIVARFCQDWGLRLPTEAEWEYACRAPKEPDVTLRYWSGDFERDLARVGWYAGNSGGKLHAVAEKPANPFGLFDVHGNVWEWVQDKYSHSDSESQRAHPEAYEDEDRDRAFGYDRRVLRGGSFASPAEDARSASREGRGWLPADGNDAGFRPVKNVTTY